LNFHEEPRGYYVVYNSEVQNPMLVKQKNVRAACGVQIYRIDKITGEKIFEKCWERRRNKCRFRGHKDEIHSVKSFLVCPVENCDA
jgi:hypothetical protein